MNNLSSAGLTPLDTTATIIEHNLIGEGAQGSANTVSAPQPVSLTPLLIELQPMSSQNIATPHQDLVTSPSNDSLPPSPEQPSTSNNHPQPAQLSPIYYPQPSQLPSSNTGPPQPTQPSSTNDPLQPTTTNEQHEVERTRWDIFENFCTTYLINQGNWLDRKTREQLIVAATVIATMTFQSVISPPGGVWQADTTNGSYTCPDFGFCEAGTAVVGYVWSPDFLKFIFFNSASFFASLCVVLVLISGFPLGNKVIMWVLTVLVIVAITCMLLTYMWALGLVSPNHIFYKIRGLGYILVGIWSFLLLFVCLIQIIRIVLWVRSRGKSSTDAALRTQNSTTDRLNN